MTPYAKEIIAEYHAGATQPEIAAKRGITRASVSSTIKRWGGQLPPEETYRRMIEGNARRRKK
jgi:hypothetical protein